MPRSSRACAGGLCFHVLNRGNRKNVVFHDARDYRGFLDLMAHASARVPMRMLAYCLMENHFHLVLWPFGNGEISRWMHWLLTTHVRRYHQRYESDGRVWQGRFKAFPIQHDGHLLTVLRYVERNPLRAGLVERAEVWPWSSLRWRIDDVPPPFVDDGPVPRGSDWIRQVNRPQTEAEVATLREHARRERPFGDADWVERTCVDLDLTATLRERGRPRKGRKEECPPVSVS